MAYSQLPVFVDLNRFIAEYIKIYDSMKSLHRSVLGRQIYEKSLSCLQYIIDGDEWTKYPEEKVKSLTQLVSSVECIMQTLRIARDAKIIPFGKSAELSDRMVKILRQAKAWRKKTSEIADGQGYPHGT